LHVRKKISHIKPITRYCLDIRGKILHSFLISHAFYWRYFFRACCCFPVCCFPSYTEWIINAAFFHQKSTYRKRRSEMKNHELVECKSSTELFRSFLQLWFFLCFVLLCLLSFNIWILIFVNVFLFKKLWKAWRDYIEYFFNVEFSI